MSGWRVTRTSRATTSACNGGKSSFERKSDAQATIDEALERLYGSGPASPETVGGYFEQWTRRHPRAKRTNETNEHRITRILDVELGARPMASRQFDELRRRHVNDLVDHMLREQGRAVQGTRNVLSALSVMSEDAITDEAADDNPFKGLRPSQTSPAARARSEISS